MSARRSARLERAGASAVQIEDQVSPKRCGHFSGKDVIPLDEMLGKIKAAVDARHDPNLMILARTDARATAGPRRRHRPRRRLHRGRRRHHVRRGAGESGRDARDPGRLAAPQLVNMVVGGRTPILDLAELREMGFALVLYANAALQGAVHGMQAALGHLKETGRLDESAPVASFGERQRLVRKPLFDELEKRYSSKD